MSQDIRIVKDLPELFHVAAVEFVRCVKNSIAESGLCSIALSGGSTPKGLYSLLATDSNFRKEIPWNLLHFFWGDERHVSPDHADSNYRMAKDALLSKVSVPEENIHRIRSENSDVIAVAEAYAREIRNFFHVMPGQFPRFDLTLLGMGPDGHTASLFPGTKALLERERLVVSNWVGKFNAERITLTAPVFNNSAEVLFLISGEDKAAPLKAVLHGRHEPAQLPAQLINPQNGSLIWIVEQSAARLL